MNPPPATAAANASGMSSQAMIDALPQAHACSRGRDRQGGCRSRSPAPRASTSTRPDGTRWIDFNSQLMSVLHRPRPPEGDRGDQGAGWTTLDLRLSGHRPPRSRARLGKLLAELVPGRHQHLLLHPGRRRGQRERDPGRAALHRAQKILARYRSYHGGTNGCDAAHRRSAPLGQRAGHARASST